jgi:hypothetical protein
MNAENYAYFLASDWSNRRKPLLQPRPATPTRAPVVSLYDTAVSQWIPSSLPTPALSELPLPSPFTIVNETSQTMINAFEFQTHKDNK